MGENSCKLHSGKLDLKEAECKEFSGLGLARWRSGKESACQCRTPKRRRFEPCIGKLPWSRKRQPTPAFLLGKSHERRGRTGYGPWGRKESETTEQLSTRKAHTDLSNQLGWSWLQTPCKNGCGEPSAGTSPWAILTRLNARPSCVCWEGSVRGPHTKNARPGGRDLGPTAQHEIRNPSLKQCGTALWPEHWPRTRLHGTGAPRKPTVWQGREKSQPKRTLWEAGSSCLSRVPLNCWINSSPSSRKSCLPGVCRLRSVLVSKTSCCCCYVASVVSDSVWPHRQQPTRLCRPWDFPGKRTISAPKLLNKAQVTLSFVVQLSFQCGFLSLVTVPIWGFFSLFLVCS